MDFLHGSALDVAPRLLGCVLERELDGRTVRVRVVETEAYDQSDEASHSYRGRTPRTDVMFGPAGRLYVYFTYGMHYCCNVVTGGEGEGSAVLIRAVEPIGGGELLSATDGPAKLCRTLGIDKGLNGHDLREPPLKLVATEPLPAAAITTTTRVGISRARDELRRFYETGNPYVSKK